MPTAFTRALAPWLCAALLGLGALATHAAEATPVALDTGFEPAAQAGGLVKVSDLPTLKGLRRVAVPQFSIDFVTNDNVTAQTSGFGGFNRASATGYYKLVGVTEADFQRLAEQVYAQLLADLKASGLEVVPLDEVSASATWRKLTAGGRALPSRSDSLVSVGMPGMAQYGLGRINGASSRPGLFGALEGLSSGVGALSAVTDNIALQKDLGDAALLEVHMRVHFAKLESNTRGFLGRMAMNARVKAELVASIQSATMAVQNGARVSTLTLGAPLLLDPAAFSALREEATTTGDVVGAVAVGLLRLATGSSDNSSYVKYEAVADTERYAAVVGQGLGTVGQLFSQRLRSER